MGNLKPFVYDFYEGLITRQVFYYDSKEEIIDFYHNTFLWSLDDTYNFDLKELKTRFNNTNNSKLKIIVDELAKTIHKDEHSL